MRLTPFLLFLFLDPIQLYSGAYSFLALYSGVTPGGAWGLGGIWEAKDQTSIQGKPPIHRTNLSGFLGLISNVQTQRWVNSGLTTLVQAELGAPTPNSEESA